MAPIAIPPFILAHPLLAYPLLVLAACLLGAWLGAVYAEHPLRAYDRPLHATNAGRGGPFRTADTTDAQRAERARLAYPARRYAARLTVLLPLFLGLGTFWFARSLGSPSLRVRLALAGALAAAIPSLWVRFRIERRALGMDIRAWRWLRGLLTRSLLGRPSLIAALFLWGVMPATFGFEAFGWLCASIVLYRWLGHDGTVRVACWARLLHPASERLRAVVRAVSARAGKIPPAVYELSYPRAEAISLWSSRIIIVTDEALATLDDEELRAVCAHELAFLSQTGFEHRARTIVGVPLLIVLAFTMTETSSTMLNLVVMIALLIFLMVLLTMRYARVPSVDARAVEFVEDARLYAKALARMVDVNVMPVVLRGRGPTPDLYDRMIAVGYPPVYARPQPPSFARASRAFWLAVVVAAGSVWLAQAVAPPWR